MPAILQFLCLKPTFSSSFRISDEVLYLTTNLRLKPIIALVSQFMAKPMHSRENPHL
jgi:hypothetical protein